MMLELTIYIVLAVVTWILIVVTANPREQSDVDLAFEATLCAVFWPLVWVVFGSVVTMTTAIDILRRIVKWFLGTTDEQ